MKTKMFILSMLVLMGGGVFAQTDKDTLSYPDWRYLYPPLDTSCLRGIRYPDTSQGLHGHLGWGSPLWSAMYSCASPCYNGNIEYVAIQPRIIYGIAITTLEHGPYFLRTMDGLYGYTVGDTMFRPDPPNVDSSTLNIYAVLIQKVSGSGADCEMVHVDSVAWHKRAPDRYFRYRGNVMGDSIDRDYTAAVFEFFFDTPIEVMDTFYVGFRSDYVSAYPF